MSDITDLQEYEHRNELWRSTNLLLIQHLIDNGVEITLSIQTGSEIFPELELAGVLTNLDGNSVTFKAFEPDMGVYIPHTEPGVAILFEFSFVLNIVCMAGYPLPILHHGHGQIHGVHRDEEGLTLTIWLSPHFTTRAIRRHERLDWQPYMKATIGLRIVSPLPKKRIFLRPIVDAILRDEENRPEIMNISAGGACLLVHRELASHSMAESSSFLMIFSPFAAHGTPPHIIQCRKSGIRPDSEIGPFVGLRLQFVREIDWEKSADDLVWRNILAYGSEAFGAMVEQFRNCEL